jgi:predicted SAM-dependent methyltransferase
MKLHLGCGNRKINGFVNVDIQPDPAVDVIADITKLPFEKNSANLVYSCCVIEHLGLNDKLSFFRHISWKDALRHWHDVLKPGGEIYISTSNFEAVCEEYLKNKNLSQLLGITIGGQKNEEDLHGMLFDYKILSEGLQEVGFEDVEKYNWWEFEPFTNDPEYDDFSAAYLPHLDKENGRLMTLNLKGKKKE